jgi:hypothetical protein
MSDKYQQELPQLAAFLSIGAHFLVVAAHLCILGTQLLVLATHLHRPPLRMQQQCWLPCGVR